MASEESDISLTGGFHFNFDWAENVEDQLRSQDLTGWDLCDNSPEPPSEPHRENDHVRDVEYVVEDGTTDINAKIVSIPSTEDVSPLIQLHQNIAEEFRGRDNYMVYDEHVHHFNWLGDPVYQASATTPAESLAIICGGPKVPKEKEKLRIGSILNRAYQSLDPIVVSLERTSDCLFTYRGFSLQRAAEGHVFKFYTPQGRWLVDQHVFDGGMVLLDTGSIEVYLNPDYSVGNGFTSPSLIPNRSDWQSARHEKLLSRQTSSLPRKNTWSPPPPSALRQSTTISDSVHKVPKRKPATYESQRCASVRCRHRSLEPLTIPFIEPPNVTLSKHSIDCHSQPSIDLDRNQRRRQLVKAAKKTWKLVSEIFRRVS